MFCKNCGSRLPEGAGFCPGCGAQIKGTPRAPSQGASKPVLPLPRHTTQKALKGRIFNWLMIPVGVLLLVMGLGHMALAVVGGSVNAQVTGCEQVLLVNNDDSTRNPSRYKLTYQFSVDGEPYTGSVTRVFSGGTHMRKTLPVRYLPFWPYVNAEDRDMDPSGPVVLGVGILLLVIGVGKKFRNSNKS